MTVVVPLDLLNLLLGAVLPVLTALITARFAASGVKAIVLALLTVLSVTLQGVLDNEGLLDVRPFLMTITFQFIVSVGLHYGLLKPTGITGAAGAVATAVPAGIGGPAERPGPIED